MTEKYLNEKPGQFLNNEKTLLDAVIANIFDLVSVHAIKNHLLSLDKDSHDDSHDTPDSPHIFPITQQDLLTFDYARPEGKGGGKSGGGGGGGKGGGGKNKAPNAIDDSYTVAANSSGTFDVLANDTDANGDLLTITSVATAVNGTVVLNTDGTITYTPDISFEGIDTFFYTISDGKGGVDTAQVTVTVGNPNISPDAVNDSATTFENEGITINVLVNDTDANGDVLTITSVSNADHGTVVYNNDGTITYIPDQNYTGKDSFTYTISDGNGGIDTATVNVTVDPPAPPYYVEALLRGGSWSETTITYQFVTELPSYYSSTSTEANNFLAFNQTMIDAALRVFDMVESFTNIQFVEATSDYGQITLASADLGSSVGAWAYYPSSSSLGGDIWMNNYWNQIWNPAEGNWAFSTIMHELGHALGLEHSFDTGDGDFLTGVEDTNQYTVMAYDNHPSGGYEESYMLYDIAALQYLYGTDTTYNSGNDVYALRSGDIYTLWDTGGTDTMDGSHITANMTINLNEGEFSTVGKANNIAVAYGAVMENANGGAGNDILIGNDVDNVLDGNGGSDHLFGGAGNDTLYYDGVDVLDGGTGNDTLVAFYDAIIDVGSNFLSSIEIFDLSDGFTDVVNVILDDILGLSDTDDLYIVGDIGVDSVNVTGGLNGGTVNMGGIDYTLYTNGAADLFIEAGLVVNEVMV